MSSKYRVLCGTPKEHCTGGVLQTDQQFPTNKCHSSHEDAFRCYVRYLVQELGYIRIGGHEFLEPGVTVHVISKKSRFGGLLVTGKEHKRYMPEKRKQGNRGVIIG